MDDDAAKAEQEASALERVKLIRHPFVLSMDLIKVVRDRWQFYRDRRPDAYEGLVAP